MAALHCKHTEKRFSVFILRWRLRWVIKQHGRTHTCTLWGGKNKEEAYRGFESYKMEELVTLETLVEVRNCFFIQEFTLLV